MARIGSTETLLPQSGGMLMLRDWGEVSYDRVEFTHCRAYQAESAISFDDPVDGATSAGSTATRGRQRQTGAIPAGLNVAIALTAPLTERAAVGDSVEGRIVDDVKSRGEVIVPRGSAIRGRLRELDRPADLGGCSVGIEFTDIDMGRSSIRFFAEMQNVDAIPGLERRLTLADSAGPSSEGAPAVMRGPGGMLYSNPRQETLFPAFVKRPDLPGVGFLFMRGERFTIPAGFHMVWKTGSM